MELLLAVLGSCLSVGYAANAAAMDVELEDDVDLRGFLGIDDDVRAGYDSVSCTVHVDADASEEELAELRDRVEATSPLMDTVTDAVPLETELVPVRGGE